MNASTHRKDKQPTAATPDGNDTIGKLEERDQRDAEERSRQALENQGAQGRKPDPAPGAPTDARPRR
jgi:hypothetical protein